MPTIQDLFENAVRHHEQGQLVLADQMYQQVLKAAPSHAESWHLLGIVRSQQGANNGAACIEKAIALDPTNSSYHSNLGVLYHSQGKFDDAIASLRRALQLQPGSADTNNSLGDSLRRHGEIEEAIQHFEIAIRLAPNYAAAHFNLGIAFRQSGNVERAIQSFSNAIKLNVNYEKAYVHLAHTFREQGDIHGATAVLSQAIKVIPNDARLINEYGMMLQEQCRNSEALTQYQRATELAPDFAAAFNNLGTLKQELGEFKAAIDCYRKSLELNHDAAEVHINLGNALREQKQLADAAACYQNALKLQPESIPALSQLAFLRRHVCDWTDFEAHNAKLIQAVEQGSPDVPPFSFINIPNTTAQQQLKCATSYVQNQRSLAHGQAPKPAAAATARPKERLTIGYVSGDFRIHAMSSLFAELFELHDRNRFNIIGYSHGPNDNSEVRNRIMRSLDKTIDIRNDSYAAAAQKIREDGVDILVDLMGHQHHARPEIFAERPAPIQVNYLAYPGTSGMPFMDYILMDEFIATASDQANYSEQLVFLPDCYQVNDRKRKVGNELLSRQDHGLPETAFVFCSFNQTYKITPEIFAIWMTLLKQVPESILWLWESNDLAPANLRLQARAQGVNPDRLIFATLTEMEKHLARYRCADLVLDTFPYNGHTTTSDALWVGCPVLTLAGSTFPSRVAGSLLSAIELPELITYSKEEYFQQALQLAHMPEKLSDIRKQVVANKHTAALFDTERFTRNIEIAYETMWQRFAANRS